MKLKSIFGFLILIQFICVSCTKDTLKVINENNDDEIETPTSLNLSTTIVDTNLPARNGAEIIEFSGKYWFMGGKEPKLGRSSFFNDIWNSTDGENWSLVTDSAPWSKRGNFNLFVFQNKLWLIGGIDNLQTLNDIWNTTDGITWQKITDHGPWQTRSSMAVKIHDNKLYLVGGHTTTNWVLYQDIWESDNGVNWTHIGEISDDLLGTSGNGGIQKHSFTKLNNEYFMISGQLSSSWAPLTSVLKSTDMVNWEVVTRDTPWKAYANSNVSNLRPFTYKGNLMLVVNSIINGESKSILYTSINGFDWEEQYELPSFISDPGYAFLGLLYKPRSLKINDQIYLYGSYQSTVIYNVPDTQTHLIKITNQ